MKKLIVLMLLALPLAPVPSHLPIHLLPLQEPLLSRQKHPQRRLKIRSVKPQLTQPPAPPLILDFSNGSLCQHSAGNPDSKDPGSQINVRERASTNSEVRSYGQAGDAVQVMSKTQGMTVRPGIRLNLPSPARWVGYGEILSVFRPVRPQKLRQRQLQPFKQRPVQRPALKLRVRHSQAPLVRLGIR